MCSTGQDCYFYFYSTCNKGKDCPFRHCELALGSETVCTLWKEDLCVRENCRFRHMDCRYKRNKVRCYYEDHGGCRKPHCPFFHAKLRNLNLENTEGLILPVLAEASVPQPDPTVPDVSPESIIDVRNTETVENVSLSHVASPTSVPVEPVVVRLNDGEESDTESTTGSPAKKPCSKSSLGKNSSKKDDEEGDFVIKSWEQIRMEKIHRESDNFYKSDVDPHINNGKIRQAETLAGGSRNFHCSVYDAPALETIPKVPERMSKVPERVSKISERKNVLYPENEYGIGDTMQNVTWDSSSDDRLASSDLRDIIQKRKVENQLRQDFSNSNKRIISFKNGMNSVDSESSLITITVNEQESLNGEKPKGRFAKETQKTENSKDKTLDFKIKSLDEIRKEKNKRKLGSDASENEKSIKSIKCDEVEKEKSKRKLDSDIGKRKLDSDVGKRKLDSDVTDNGKSTKHTKCNEEDRKEKPVIVPSNPSPKPKVKRPARELYQVKPKEGLSPRKMLAEEGLSPRKMLSEEGLSPRKKHSDEETEISKKIKLSPINGIHSSSDEEKFGVAHISSFSNGSTKHVTSEIPGRRVVRLNRSKIFSNTINYHNSSDPGSEEKEKTKIKSQPEKKSVVLNSIRPFIRHRRKDPSKLACDESLSADTTRQSSSRSPDCIPASRLDSSNAILNSSDISNGDLSLSNGVSSTKLNDQNMTYDDDDEDDESDVKLLKISVESSLPQCTLTSSSTDKKANQSSSSIDDIDRLLLGEAEDFISDLDSTEEKGEDIFFEIEQMLKS